MTTALSLRERYAEVMGRIAQAARRSGRSASDILLVAVTKRAEQDQIRELLGLGQRDFGESRVQSLVQRAAMVDEYLTRLRTAPSVAASRDGAAKTPPAEGVRWHMMGRLQRNKVKKAIEIARLIHSVDSLRLAEEIQTFAVRKDQTVDVLLQVNCSGEGTKQGVALPAAIHVAAQIDTMVHVRLRGVMTMAPLTENPANMLDAARFTFERGRDVFEEIRTAGVGGADFKILSMGMSGDYEAAIEMGANVVRIGTAIFGEGDQNSPEHHDGHEGDEDEE